MSYQRWNIVKCCNRYKLSFYLQINIKTEINETDLIGKPEKADLKRLNNLLQRQKIYGDITQSSTPKELEMLLRFYDNNVPEVIFALERKIEKRGFQTLTPPAFYDRDGSFIQPPSFQMPIGSMKTSCQ